MVSKLKYLMTSAFIIFNGNLTMESSNQNPINPSIQNQNLINPLIQNQNQSNNNDEKRDSSVDTVDSDSENLSDKEDENNGNKILRLFIQWTKTNYFTKF